MRHNIWLIRAALAIIALVLTACAPATPAAAPEAASQPVAGGDGKIELRIAWWGSQSRHDRTIAVIEQFEQLHPNIDIVYEFAGWADYWTLMSTQAAGGNLPISCNRTMHVWKNGCREVCWRRWMILSPTAR